MGKRIMSEMVERAARAICRHVGEDPEVARVVAQTLKAAAQGET